MRMTYEDWLGVHPSNRGQPRTRLFYEAIQDLEWVKERDAFFIRLHYSPRFEDLKEDATAIKHSLQRFITICDEQIKLSDSKKGDIEIC